MIESIEKIRADFKERSRRMLELNDLTIANDRAFKAQILAIKDPSASNRLSAKVLQKKATALTNRLLAA